MPTKSINIPPKPNNIPREPLEIQKNTMNNNSVSLLEITMPVALMPLTSH